MGTEGGAFAAKAVETQGKGSVFVAKAVEAQDKGADLATKAVKTQGKGSVLTNLGTCATAWWYAASFLAVGEAFILLISPLPRY